MFLQGNVTVFIEKSDGFYKTLDNLDFPVKTVKFSYKNMQIFLKKS